MAKLNRFHIVGNGSQAPYGIDEIITTAKTLNAAVNKILKMGYYNEPWILDSETDQLYSVSCKEAYPRM